MVKRPPRIQAWHLYAALAAGMALAYLVLPTGSVPQAAVFMAAEFEVVVVLGATALRATKASDRAIWAMLALGQAVSLAGNLNWYWAPVAWGAMSEFPSIADAMFLGSYGISIVAVAYIIRKRSRGNGWGPLADAGIITAAVAGLSWAYLIEPNLMSEGLTAHAKAVAVAYPVTDLVMFTLVVRLVATGRHLPSAWLLACWGGSQLIGDTLFAASSVAGSFSFGGPYFLGWLVAYGFIGTAAFHPSRRNLISHVDVLAGRVTNGKMAFLAIAVVMAPVFMVLVGFDDAVDGYVFGGIATAIFLLVFTRMAGVVSSLGRAESLSRHLSLHDPLTGLPNRALVGDRTVQALSEITRSNQPVSFLVIDLDEFKQVNDSFGHDSGDRLLRQVGEKLKSCIRPSDTAARWGGDEFCVLLPGADETAAVVVARRMLNELVTPVQRDGKELSTGASVGIATCSGGAMTAEELFRNADDALYASKAAGKRRYQVFKPSMHGVALQTLELRLDLERAIGADEFEVDYQPIINLGDGDVVEVEALVRWNHPHRGRLAPLEFISLAEESGLIVPLGDLVLRKACAQVAEWQRMYPSAAQLKLSVNVSPRQLVEPGFRDRVVQVLRETGLRPMHLVCEVTERGMVDEASEAVPVLASLREASIRVAIDDFGTGYSSLRYLTELPADIVKIDASFARRASTEEERAFVLSIVRVIETIGLQTVAEGIETREQAEYLHAMGCDRGQGYYFARPMDATAFSRLLGGGDRFPVGEREADGHVHLVETVAAPSEKAPVGGRAVPSLLAPT